VPSYNVISPATMAAGQPEDVSVILANFNAIAAILNGGFDNSNIAPAAGIVYSKLALASAIVNGDISPAAAIGVSKLAPGSNGQVLTTSGGAPVWGVGAVGGMTLIAETAASGSSTTISFASLPQTYKALRAYCFVRSQAAIGQVDFRFRANSVSGVTDYLSRNTNSVSDYNSSGYIGSFPGANMAATDFGLIIVDFYNYTDATNRKNFGSQYSAKTASSGTAGNDLTFGSGGGMFFVNTAQAAVTQLDFLSTNGNLTATSKVALYGIG
jgi:hypothetical protein